MLTLVNVGPIGGCRFCTNNNLSVIYVFVAEGIDIL